MDESVRQAMQKWPDVPALYGWLSLDEAGHWRLQGERITHPGLIAFINRNYERDADGRWFFQNGPQRGFVHLDYTPWVAYVDGGGTLVLHTEEPMASVAGAWVDEHGNLLLDTGRGPALVEPGSLPAAVAWLQDDDGAPATTESLEAATRGEDPALWLAYGGRRVPLRPIRRKEVAERFGFVAHPEDA
jgi:hypothetical protein